MIPTRGSSSGKRRRGTDPNPQFGREGCKTQVSTGPTTIPFRYREGPSHQNMNYNMLDQGFSNTTMLPKHSTAPGLVIRPGSLRLQARNRQELKMVTMRQAPELRNRASLFLGGQRMRLKKISLTTFSENCLKKASETKLTTSSKLRFREKTSATACPV